jgi:hypothetical protein
VPVGPGAPLSAERPSDGVSERLSVWGRRDSQGMSELVPEAEAEAEAPFLDLIHQSSTNSQWCPSAVQTDLWMWINRDTGEIRYGMRCRRNGCPYCVHVNARRRGLAIALAEPERAITLTQVAPADDPDAFGTARRRINRTREFYKREGLNPGEWLWHLEPNPAGTGHHAHIWQHGRDKIDTDALRIAQARAGLGAWHHVSRVTAVLGSATYGLKGLGYGMKGTDDSPDRYLDLNGGRLTHQSRGYFRGRGVRSVEVEALRIVTEGQESPWMLTSRSA